MIVRIMMMSADCARSAVLEPARVAALSAPLRWAAARAPWRRSQRWVPGGKCSSCAPLLRLYFDKFLLAATFGKPWLRFWRDPG